MLDAYQGPEAWDGDWGNRLNPQDARGSSANADDDSSAEIAIVLGQFGTGGVERVACYLANGFAAAGLKPRVLCARDSGAARGLLTGHVHVEPLSAAARPAPRGLSLVAALPALARALHRRRPAVLLSPGNHTHVVAALAHRMCGRSAPPLILKITNPLIKRDTGPIARLLRRTFYRWAFARADRILLLSEGDRIGLRDVDPAALARAVVVANPYVVGPADGGAPAAPADGPPVILCVGRLDRQKNHARLFRALALIRDRDWRLVLLGAGPYEARLRRLAADLGIADRIDFRGYVPDPWPVYRTARLLAISSDWEGLPAVAIEAMSMGCPVVATDCSPGLSSVVRESGLGRIASGASDADLAEAIALELATTRARSVPPAVAAYRADRAIAAHVDVVRVAAAGRGGRR